MPQLPNSLVTQLEGALQTRILKFNPTAGGCISNGGELITATGTYFLKWNDATRYPAMFQAEAKGLRLLASYCTLRIPKVIGVTETEAVQAIVLEFIDLKYRSGNFWELLGRRLAALHRNTADAFGLDHDNYIGSLKQSNTSYKSWIDFFIEQRLEPQLALAGVNGLIDTNLRSQFQVLYKKLPELLPAEQPALLHGDLWPGNLIADEQGEPCLIDPAVYFGHREAELAFTRLFGGFDETFYYAYQNVFPLQPHFEVRVNIYNLYPLLVHVNLFGGAYINQVKQIVIPLVR